MPTVAEQLRHGREARKLTVDQVAELTKIRTDHVRALEEGDFEAFSATIYIRGSVKLYGNLLKLDVPQLIAALDSELKITDKFSEPPPLMETKKTFVDSLMLFMSKVNWKMGMAGLIALAGIIVVGIVLVAISHRKPSDPVKNLPPAVYQSSSPGDTLPLTKH